MDPPASAVFASGTCGAYHPGSGIATEAEAAEPGAGGCAIIAGMVRSRRVSNLRSRGAGAVLAGLAVLVVAAVAAGCSSGPKPEYDANQAADQLAKTLGADQAQTDCMRTKIQADPAIATVFNTGDKPTTEQKSGYVAALRSCLPVEDFATLLGSTLGDASLGTCVHDTVLGFSPGEQDQLYLWFSNPGAIDPAEVAPTTKKLAEACHLDDLAPGDPNPTGPPGTASYAPPP